MLSEIKYLTFYVSNLDTCTRFSNFCRRSLFWLSAAGYQITPKQSSLKQSFAYDSIDLQYGQDSVEDACLCPACAVWSWLGLEDARWPHMSGAVSWGTSLLRHLDFLTWSPGAPQELKGSSKASYGLSLEATLSPFCQILLSKWVTKPAQIPGERKWTPSIDGRSGKVTWKKQHAVVLCCLWKYLPQSGMRVSILQ